jgi:CPA1 family monovalent cation:H+ antiporter
LLLLVGALVATSNRFPEFSLNPSLILLGFLPALLFDAGFSMRVAAIRRELRWILLLGVVGALLGAAISYAILRGLGFSVNEALLLSAVLAATDPVSIFAVMRRLRVAERLRVTLEGESLANDGVAAVLFALALTIVGGRGSSPPGLVGQFLLLTLGGLLAGGLVGLVLARLLPDRVIVLVPATAVAAYATYLLADRVGASGLLAVVMLAVVLGNRPGWASHHTTHRVWRIAGFSVSSLVFILVGLQLHLDRLSGSAVGLLGVVLAVVVARIAMVAVVTFRTWTARMQAALVWAGLRGALSLALSLSIPADLPARARVLLLVSGFVFVSLAIQGLLVGPVYRVLHVLERAENTVSW